MSAVSLGFFDPHYLHPEPDHLAKAIEHTFGHYLDGKASFPLHVASIDNTAVSFALVGGHIPMHRDPIGDHDVDGRIFQLVLATRSRPVLLTTPTNDHNDILIAGDTKATATFGIGAVEMRRGMAIHFDITDTWHGVSGLPYCSDEGGVDRKGNASRRWLPMAAIVQVSGQPATDIETAVELARAAIGDSLLARNIRRA